MTRHEVTGPVHRLWNPAHPPALTVADGDEIAFAVLDASDALFAPPATSADIATFDWARLYPLVGPIWVHGAEPGDTVEVEVLDITAGAWGWTAVLPGFGLLADDFPEPHLHHWDLTDGKYADFLGLARVPLRPFCGVMGVCPDTVEPLAVVPPGHFGGNIDCRDVSAGSRLFLPVQLPGARLSIGDSHAAQGDGEVCGCAIEAPASAAVRIRLHKGRRIAGPQLQTPGPLRAGIDDAGYYATMGVGPDLMAAARDAVRAMIDYLDSTYGVNPRDAYVLASVAADLKISEVVDAPNWVVSAYLPLSIMTG
ncbi:MAG: acetamidase/formamidase family protein [Frankia sp.]